MEGGLFSKCSFRLSAANTRLEHVQQFHGWRAAPFQHITLACSAAHIRVEHVQQFQGWRAVRFQNVALAVAPRTFVLNIRNSFKYGGRLVFQM